MANNVGFLVGKDFAKTFDVVLYNTSARRFSIVVSRKEMNALSSTITNVE